MQRRQQHTNLLRAVLDLASDLSKRLMTHIESIGEFRRTYDTTREETSAMAAWVLRIRKIMEDTDEIMAEIQNQINSRGNLK